MYTILPEKPIKNSDELAGFDLVVHLMRLFGISIHPKKLNAPVLNRYICGCILFVGLVTFAVASPTLYLQIVDEAMPIWILINASYLFTILTYVWTIYSTPHAFRLLRGLISAIDDLENPDVRSLCVRRIKLKSKLILASLVAFISYVAITVVMNGQFYGIPMKNKTTFDVVTSKITNIGSCIWISTLVLFYIFANFVVILVSQTIITLIDANTQPNEQQFPVEENIWKKRPRPYQLSIAVKIVRAIDINRKLKSLVSEADRTFSGLMLLCLGMELLVSVVYVKSLSIQNGNFSLNANQYSSVIVLFLWKAYYCGIVNDKLKSSLTLRNVPNSLQDLEHCSAEHVNYILYLNEQLINKAELTYGGFFPVRKTFIFTIAGTALTYALVLNGIGSG